jgi:hypothetical protein
MVYPLKTLLTAIIIFLTVSEKQGTTPCNQRIDVVEQFFYF